MRTETYCLTLKALDPVKAVRAIHLAWLQLNYSDLTTPRGSADNALALQALASCLKDAGHPGFAGKALS